MINDRDIDSRCSIRALVNAKRSNNIDIDQIFIVDRYIDRNIVDNSNSNSFNL
jgi:hypothetical protein